MDHGRVSGDHSTDHGPPPIVPMASESRPLGHYLTSYHVNPSQTSSDASNSNRIIIPLHHFIPSSPSSRTASATSIDTGVDSHDITQNRVGVCASCIGRRLTPAWASTRTRVFRTTATIGSGVVSSAVQDQGPIETPTPASAPAPASASARLFLHRTHLIRKNLPR